jgi:hypothetical protein
VPDGHLLCVADELVAETEKIPSSIIGPPSRCAQMVDPAPVVISTRLGREIGVNHPGEQLIGVTTNHPQG